MALGFGRWPVQRDIVLPQALRLVVPAQTNNVVGTLKDTSLVTVVGLFELTGALGLALGGDPTWRPFYLEGYLFIAGPAIDRDGETVTRQPPRDHRPQPPRATRHQSDTPMRHCHMVMIPLAQLAGPPRLSSVLGRRRW